MSIDLPAFYIACEAMKWNGEGFLAEFKEFVGKYEAAKASEQSTLTKMILESQNYEAPDHGFITEQPDDKTEIDDSAMVMSMLAACDGLEDLEDCMTAALQPIKHHYEGLPKRESGNLENRLKTAIGGLRSIAYGDARTWPKEDARLVAIQALEDCGGEKGNGIEGGES